MVEAQDENNFCLVAEAGGKAIGFLSICAEVNVPFLQVSKFSDLNMETFKLRTFSKITKMPPQVKLSAFSYVLSFLLPCIFQCFCLVIAAPQYSLGIYGCWQTRISIWLDLQCLETTV